ncbi:Transcriptional regulatory protein CusR [BD1-7 clade bacterium]|uniref:Transcriptional regulatory protein CusR n=1 Tax=BD1-7 clade bacterium TaxID=2029982 RepID=A0A5S9QYP2_9GAMM|nr:Transcriptional regulatory protein CusR [BD1-7 clade bacterium]
MQDLVKILLIEDDLQVSEFISDGLQNQEYAVEVARDGDTGKSMAIDRHYDLLIVDRMLPGCDGINIVETVRAKGNRVPVLFLSALGDVDDRVDGLKAGGDDYLVKPFAMEELLARIEVLLRRKDAIATTRLKVGELELDLLTQKVTREGQALNLQPREFRLLEYLMKHAGQVVTRTMLLENVWEYHFDPQTNVIDVHVSRLRQKIDKDFDKPMLSTIRGAGYMLNAA